MPFQSPSRLQPSCTTRRYSGLTIPSWPLRLLISGTLSNPHKSWSQPHLCATCVHASRQDIFYGPEGDSFGWFVKPSFRERIFTRDRHRDCFPQARRPALSALAPVKSTARRAWDAAWKMWRWRQLRTGVTLSVRPDASIRNAVPNCVCWIWPTPLSETGTSTGVKALELPCGRISMRYFSMRRSASDGAENVTVSLRSSLVPIAIAGLGSDDSVERFRVPNTTSVPCPPPGQLKTCLSRPLIEPVATTACSFSSARASCDLMLLR